MNSVKIIKAMNIKTKNRVAVAIVHFTDVMKVTTIRIAVKSENYSLGKIRASWGYTEPITTMAEAEKKFAKYYKYKV